MGREFRLLTMVRTAYPKVPRPLLFCDDAAVLEIILRNVEIRRGFEIDPKTHTPLAHAARTTS